jgi:hypothetical protein
VDILCNCITNDEFLIVDKKVDRLNDRTPIVILAWNVGHLGMHTIEHQSYYVPKPCMVELLPHGQWYFGDLKSNWVLIINLDYDMDKSERQYLLYDILRGRLAASFSAEESVKPKIGKVAPDKVQIYCGNTTQTSNGTIASKSCQYCWHTIEVSVQPNTPTSTIDLTWYDQTPTNEAIEAVRKKHHAIIECIKDQGYWCGEGYLLNVNLPNKVILPSVKPGTTVWLRHFTEDLFLLSNVGPNSTYGISLIHSSSQQYIWSGNGIHLYELIPEEKVIVAYYLNGTVRLLDVYTGDTLNTFKFQLCCIVKHIIGSLCVFHGRENVLIDVRTGEKVCTFELDSMIQSRILSALLPDVESDNILITSGPTRIMYANKCLKKVSVYEYAQILSRLNY